MNSRERFRACLDRRRADRVPIDYLSHPRTDENLRKFYGIGTEEELLDRLGCDFYYLSCRDISQNESCLPFYKGPKLDFTEKERTCPFGIRWQRGVYRTKFASDEVLGGPLAGATTPREILRHRWPRVANFDFSPLVGEAERHADRVIVGGLWTGLLGDSFRLHGFENFLYRMAAEPRIVHTLVNKVRDVYLEFNDHVFSLLKGRLDVWFFGSDFGSQSGLLFSANMLAEYFLEPIRELTALARGYGLKVMMHSCGGIAEIIPLLLEAGIEILDPVQTTARGMDPSALKQRFGDRLVFHGGIDTQQVLPRGTLQEVRQHALDMIRTLGRGGGYIFAPSQILQGDVPVENIDAMYRSAREHTQ